MNKRSRIRIDAFIAAEAAPKRLKGSDAIALQQGKSIIKIVGDDGEATAAGTYWSRRSGTPLPVGGYMQQTAVRVGTVETIKMRDGKSGVTRRWHEGSGEYRFTALGNSYYRTLRRNYIVNIPVSIRGRRADGSTYEVKSSMPISRLGLTEKTLPLNMTSPVRRARVRAMVEAELPAVLYEQSEETWTLDAAGSWIIHEETVGTHPDTGEAEAHTVLDRPTGALPVLSQFLFSDELCPEAFEDHDDHLCCPRQMAAVLKIDYGAICDDLYRVEGLLYQTTTWEERGVTPRMVLEFCRMRSYGCAIVHNEAVLETLPGKPVLAFAVHAGHSYFYSRQQVAQMLQRRRTTAVQRLKKDQRATTTPPASEWLPWLRKLVPGHYGLAEEELNLERAWFLERGLHPKVLLKSETSARALLYNCSKRLDGCTGSVHLHALPDHSAEVARWVGELDCGLIYRGEGLPNMALKALHRLIKNGREREWLTGEQKAELLEQYDHKCALCNARAGTLEFDHIARHSEGYGEQEFQPLCPACHRVKTDTEARSHDEDQLASHFEKSVYEQYVESPRPPPLVHRQRALQTIAGLEIADVVRCRKNALEYNVHPLPVFCPLDAVSRERLRCWVT